MKYSTVELNNLKEDNAQHICINDILDIVVVKEGSTYKVKVLTVPNHDIRVELIGYNEFESLLELE